MKLLRGLTASVTAAVLLSLFSTRSSSQHPTSDPAAPRPFVVRVVDEATGRGVPLVKLRLLSQQAWYTDSNGIVALAEPWLLGQKVFLIVTSDGYALEDAAGVWDQPGTFLTVLPGAEATLRLRRINIAERLYRMTGAGIYAHSVAAGLPVPLRQPLLNAKVTGQDTGVAIAYKGLIYWF